MANDINDLITISSERYNLQEEWINKISSKYLDINDINTLKIGLYGYINEVLATITRNSVAHRNFLYDEAFLNTASLTTSIYNKAKSYNYDIPMANPASVEILFTISQDDIVKYGTPEYDSDGKINGNYTFTLSQDNLFKIGNYTFMAEADIDIKATKIEYSTISYGKRKTSYTYAYSASYNRNNTYNKLGLFSGESNLYISTWVDRSETAEDLITLEFKIYQVEKSTTVFENYSSNTSDNLLFEKSFSDNLCNFMVKYKNETVNQYIPKYFNDTFTPDDKYYCFYSFTENKLNIYFSGLPNNFKPTLNSVLTLEVYTTAGSKGNFNYTGDIKYTFSNSKYNQIKTLIQKINNPSNGSDMPDKLEIKKQLINEFLTRDNLITEYDLKTYFNSLIKENLVNSSEILFIKKRDDIMKRLYASFLLLRDKSGLIIPTNTIDVNLCPCSINEDMYIPAGSTIGYNKYKYIKYIDKSDPVFTNNFKDTKEKIDEIGYDKLYRFENDTVIYLKYIDEYQEFYDELTFVDKDSYDMIDSIKYFRNEEDDNTLLLIIKEDSSDQELKKYLSKYSYIFNYSEDSITYKMYIDIYKAYKDFYNLSGKCQLENSEYIDTIHSFINKYKNMIYELNENRYNGFSVTELRFIINKLYKSYDSIDYDNKKWEEIKNNFENTLIEFNNLTDLDYSKLNKSLFELYKKNYYLQINEYLQLIPSLLNNGEITQYYNLGSLINDLIDKIDNSSLLGYKNYFIEDSEYEEFKFDLTKEEDVKSLIQAINNFKSFVISNVERITDEEENNLILKLYRTIDSVETIKDKEDWELIKSDLDERINKNRLTDDELEIYNTFYYNYNRNLDFTQLLELYGYDRTYQFLNDDSVYIEYNDSYKNIQKFFTTIQKDCYKFILFDSECKENIFGDTNKLDVNIYKCYDYYPPLSCIPYKSNYAKYENDGYSFKFIDSNNCILSDLDDYIRYVRYDDSIKKIISNNNLDLIYSNDVYTLDIDDEKVEFIEYTNNMKTNRYNTTKNNYNDDTIINYEKTIIDGDDEVIFDTEDNLRSDIAEGKKLTIEVLNNHYPIDTEITMLGSKEKKRVEEQSFQLHHVPQCYEHLKVTLITNTTKKVKMYEIDNITNEEVERETELTETNTETFGIGDYVSYDKTTNAITIRNIINTNYKVDNKGNFIKDNDGNYKFTREYEGITLLSKTNGNLDERECVDCQLIVTYFYFNEITDKVSKLFTKNETVPESKYDLLYRIPYSLYYKCEDTTFPRLISVQNHINENVFFNFDYVNSKIPFEFIIDKLNVTRTPIIYDKVISDETVNHKIIEIDDDGEEKITESTLPEYRLVITSDNNVTTKTKYYYNNYSEVIPGNTEITKEKNNDLNKFYLSFNLSTSLVNDYYNNINKYPEYFVSYDPNETSYNRVTYPELFEKVSSKTGVIDTDQLYTKLGDIEGRQYISNIDDNGNLIVNGLSDENGKLTKDITVDNDNLTRKAGIKILLIFNNSEDKPIGYKELLFKKDNSSQTYAELVTNNHINENDELCLTNCVRDMYTNELLDEFYLSSDIHINVCILSKVYYDEDRDVYEITPNLPDYLDYLPHKNKGDEFYNYTLAVNFLSTRKVDFFKITSDVISPVLYFKQDDIKNGIFYSDKNKGIIMRYLPVVGKHYLYDYDVFNDFYFTFKLYYEVLQQNFDKLESNTTVNIKFYNTYGISKTFSCNKTNINLDLEIKLTDTYSQDLDFRIKNYILDFVEKINSDGKNFAMSNLIRGLENEFSDEIEYIEVAKLDDTLINGATNQTITNNAKDVNKMTREQLINYIPEYLNVYIDKETYIQGKDNFITGINIVYK